MDQSPSASSVGMPGEQTPHRGQREEEPVPVDCEPCVQIVPSSSGGWRRTACTSVPQRILLTPNLREQTVT